MTTVKQMVEWLLTLPPDATVECGIESSASAGYGNFMDFEGVDIDMCEILDYTKPGDEEKYPNMFGQTIVRIRAD